MKVVFLCVLALVVLAAAETRQDMVNRINAAKPHWVASASGHRFAGQPIGASKPLLGANQAQNKLIRLQMLKEVCIVVQITTRLILFYGATITSAYPRVHQRFFHATLGG
jgi:hypothetical protein